MATQMFFPDERIALFIDGANIWHTMQALGWDMDYELLVEYFAKMARVIRPYYFTAVKDDNSPEDSVKKLVRLLSHRGYKVVSKTALAQRNANSASGYSWKGNMDVEIAVTMLQAAKFLDHLVLFSGDGDFCFLIQALQEMGKRVTVVASHEMPEGKPKMTADSIRRQADNFIDINQLKGKVAFDVKIRTAAMLAMTPKARPSAP